MKNDKRTNNDLQNITHKTKDRVSRTQLIIGDEPGCSGMVSSSCSTNGTRCIFFFKTMLCTTLDDINSD